MCKKLPKLNFTKTKRNYDLPHEYVVSKFYELGFYPQQNKYNNTYQCCCPVCREGDSFGKKKRCFYLPDRTQIFCHNCGHGWTPYNWVSEVGGLTYEEIWDEIEDNEFDVLEKIDLNEEKKVIKLSSLPEDSINLFDPTQLVYWMNDEKIKIVLKYITDRRLSRAKNRPDALYISFKDRVHKNRLVIPFKDEKGKILFYQSRKIFDWDDKPKYISKQDAEKSVCGLDKIDTDLDSIFIFEGPIDSFFVRNGTAVGGISKGAHSLTQFQRDQYDSLKFFQKIWCLDSQWLDETSRVKTQLLIDQGETVFLWPEKYGTKYKDLNELCVANDLNEISPKFIIDNSHSGVAASMKFNLMKSKI
jgi:hypothetical protein